METETIDKLFLELSQVTKATTAKELLQEVRINALFDKIAALEADAARYRGIRDKLTYVGINAHHKQELWCLRGVFADKGSFDEAIDDAMKGGA